MDSRNDNCNVNHDTSSFNTWRLPSSSLSSSSSSSLALDKTKLTQSRKNSSIQYNGIDKHRKYLLQRRKHRRDIHKHQPSRIPIKSTRIRARKVIRKATNDLTDALALFRLSSSSSSRVTTNSSSNSCLGNNNNNNNNRNHDNNNPVNNNNHNTLNFTLNSTHLDAKNHGYSGKEQK